MKGSKVATSFLKTAKEQILPDKAGPRSWRAYTRTGKVLIILDKQVIDIIDPEKEVAQRKANDAK